MCETNPIPARPGGTWPGGRGTNVRSKANWPPGEPGPEIAQHSTILLFQHCHPMPMVRHRLDAPLRETKPLW
jgi:hypothetical protein